MAEIVDNAGIEVAPEADTDVLDGLFDEGQEAAEPATEAATQESEAQPPEQAAEPQHEGARPEEAPKTVPLPTFLDMRDENKALKAQIAELQKQFGQAQPAPSEATPEPVDFFEDPIRAMEFNKSLVGQVQALQQHIQNQHVASIETSLQAAKSQYGEAFDAAYEFVKPLSNSNQAIHNYIFSHQNPGIAVMEVARDHQLKQMAAQIPVGVSLQDWLREEAAKLPPAQPGQAAAPTQPQIKAPTPSLAAAKGGSPAPLNPGLSDDPLDDLLS